MYLEIGLGTVILIEGYVVWNLIRKTELLETWVENFTQTIETVQNDLTLIDSTGHFESDDEIGFFFEEVKSLQSMLDNLFETQEKQDGEGTDEGSQS